MNLATTLRPNKTILPFTRRVKAIRQDRCYRPTLDIKGCNNKTTTISTCLNIFNKIILFKNSS